MRILCPSSSSTMEAEDGGAISSATLEPDRDAERFISGGLQAFQSKTSCVFCTGSPLTGGSNVTVTVIVCPECNVSGNGGDVVNE